MIHSLLYFLSYLFLLPFFLRILFRYHRLPLGHPLFCLVLQLTNPFIYPIAKVISPTIYMDRPAGVFTFTVILLLTQIKFLFKPIGPFFEVLLVISALDWLNRIMILYVALGVLRLIRPFLSMPKALEALIEDFTDQAVSKLVFFAHVFPSLIQQVIRKYPLIIWVLILIFTHLIFEEMMLERLMR